MNFLIASNNKNKIKEYREIINNRFPEISVTGQQEAGYNIEVEENGNTFEENAFLKAKTLSELSGSNVISDDSGLMVDALDGAPGIFSARFGEGIAFDDKDRCELLLDNLNGVTDRRAKFVCVICCVFESGDVIYSRGECQGNIAYKSAGTTGFGYDPVFIPLGSERTMGELGSDIKNTISHRKKALDEFILNLEAYNSGIKR